MCPRSCITPATCSSSATATWRSSRPDGVQLTDFEGHPITRQVQHITWDPIMAEKGGFKHFMLKEIFEQPRAVRDTTLGRVSLDTGKVFLDEMDITEDDFRKLNKVYIAACGTSWHAGLAGKFMIERLAKVPVEVDYASEFRYRDPLTGEGDLTILITQSGETADTIAAHARVARQRREDTGHLQRGRLHDRARIQWHDLHPCRAGDRRGLDQGIHRAVDGAVPVRGLSGTGARHADAGRSKKLLDELTLIPGKLEALLHGDEETEDLAKRISPRARFPVPGTRHSLSHRAGRRAEAEGNLLHPRRRLSGGRDEARAERADRRRPAGGDSGHARS